MLILNRDLNGSMVPTFSYESVAAEGPEPELWTSPYTFAISEFERFASTFDATKYQRDTGIQFDDSGDDISGLAEQVSNSQSSMNLGTLRWGLTVLAIHPETLASDIEKAKLADQLLDAIHQDVAGSPRQTTGPGKPEPFIGVPGAIVGESQRRFGIETGQDFDRDRLFDFAAGLLLRVDDRDLTLRTLGLYPPDYRIDSERVTHNFMVLIASPGDRHQFIGSDSAQTEFVEMMRRESIAAGISLPIQLSGEN